METATPIRNKLPQSAALSLPQSPRVIARVGRPTAGRILCLAVKPSHTSAGGIRLAENSAQAAFDGRPVWAIVIACSEIYCDYQGKLYSEDESRQRGYPLPAGTILKLVNVNPWKSMYGDQYSYKTSDEIERWMDGEVPLQEAGQVVDSFEFWEKERAKAVELAMAQVVEG